MTGKKTRPSRRASSILESPRPANHETQLDVSTTRALTRDLEVDVELELPLQAGGLTRRPRSPDELQTLYESLGQASAGDSGRFLEKTHGKVRCHPARRIHTVILIIIRIAVERWPACQRLRDLNGLAFSDARGHPGH